MSEYIIKVSIFGKISNDMKSTLSQGHRAGKLIYCAMKDTIKYITIKLNLKINNLNIKTDKR